MSVTMAKTEGVTVLTLTSDPQSSLPPICQILKSLCYSPVWCSVSQRLRRIQGSSQSTLGILQIMVGLLNIGFGVIFNKAEHFWWNRDHQKFPFIFGGLFIFFGVMCILCEKCPSPCLVVLNMVLNAAGACLAIAAIVIYSISIAHIHLGEWYCNNGWNTTPSPDSEEEHMKRRCLMALKMSEMLLRSMNALLIVLSVLELCVTCSSVILGFKALRCREKRENKSPDDPECYKPLLDEVPDIALI